MSRTEAEDRRIRERFSTSRDRAEVTPACPDDEEIWAASRGELPEARVAELLSHSLECDACKESWRVAKTLALEAGLDEPATVVPFRSGLRRFAVPLAAAAAVVLALIVVSWMDVWRGPGPAPSWAAGVQTTLWRVGEAGDEPLEAGDSLRPGDRIYLTLKSDAPAYVYLINRDRSGESTTLFPIDGAQWSNPLPAGTPRRLPGDTSWQYDSWEVSSAGGRESFIVVAAARPLVQLESAIALLGAASPMDEYTRGRDTSVGRPPTASERGEAALASALEGLATRTADGDVLVRKIVLENPE